MSDLYAALARVTGRQEIRHGNSSLLWLGDGRVGGRGWWRWGWLGGGAGGLWVRICATVSFKGAKDCNSPEFLIQASLGENICAQCLTSS